MRVSVMDSSSRMSASSSTIRTRAFMVCEPVRLGSEARAFMGWIPRSSDAAARHAEVAARLGLDVIERGAVGLAYLAGDVQAEPRPGRNGGEERLEQVRTVQARDPRAVVDYAQLHAAARIVRMDADDDAARKPAAVAQRVPRQVPHHLVEVAAIEAHGGLEPELQPEQPRIDPFDAAELLHERAQELGERELLGERAVAAVQLQNVLHHAMETLRVVV